MIEMATAGDIEAIREVLLRGMGRPQEAALIERLEQLEEMALADSPAVATQDGTGRWDDDAHTDQSAADLTS